MIAASEFFNIGWIGSGILLETLQNQNTQGSLAL
jgi:hypothetical protein